MKVHDAFALRHAGGSHRARKNGSVVEGVTERPGFMIYFEMAEPLKLLGNEEKGRLFDAMIDYGQYGVVPEFDGSLSMAWGFIRPKLDADAKSYRKKVVKNTYSSYCAKEKKEGRIPIALEEWLEQEGIDTEWNRTVPVDAERYPTTTTTPITDTTTTPITDTITKGEGDREGLGGKEPTKKESFEQLRTKKMNDLLKVM